MNNVDSAPFRDAGLAFVKHNLGGFGGPLSEMDLSRESKSEVLKAIERAKKRTGTEINKAEQAIERLKSAKTPQGRQDLATQRGFLKRLKAGVVKVQYTDYKNEDGKLTKDAKNSQLILGQFWASSRDKKEGGGYRIEDKYDFKSMRKKDPKTGEDRDMTNEELFNEVLRGENKTIKQKLQAVYLMNPLKGKGDVDMVLGGKRTAEESIGLAGSTTLLGGALGMSGKPKDKNTKALEKKRPWWDKMGMFGGASAKIKEQEEQKKNLGVGAKLYDKPQPNTKQPYKSRFARPKNAGKSFPVNQPGAKLYDKPQPNTKQPDLPKWMRPENSGTSFPVNPPGAKLYDEPQPNTKQPHLPKWMRPKNAGTSPVNPPIRPRPTTLPTGSGTSSGGGNSGGKKGSGSGSQTPSFSAKNSNSSGSKQKTLGFTT